MDEGVPRVVGRSALRLDRYYFGRWVTIIGVQKNVRKPFSWMDGDDSLTVIEDDLAIERLGGVGPHDWIVVDMGTGAGKFVHPWGLDVFGLMAPVVIAYDNEERDGEFPTRAAVHHGESGEVEFLRCEGRTVKVVGRGRIEGSRVERSSRIDLDKGVFNRLSADIIETVQQASTATGRARTQRELDLLVKSARQRGG